MIVLIDNYDSFTYNLYQYFCQLGAKVTVIRNDKTDIAGLKKLDPKGIVISPGPGRPENSNCSLDAIKEFSDKIPILGVCLGHQAIGYIFNSKITYAPTIMHGKISEVYHTGNELFKGIPSPFKATRYHSLVIDPENIHPDLEIIAKTKDNVIMGVTHKKMKKLFGVQFHPESIMTTEGLKIIQNFINFI